MDLRAIHESPAPRVVLTKAGKVVESVTKTLPERYPTIQIDAYVIMPNHVHVLLRIEDERAIRESPLQGKKEPDLSKRSLLDKAIGYLKMNTSRQIHAFAPDLKVWQRAYYDHIIRNDKDYGEILAYLDENPLRWTEDGLFVAE